MRDYMDDKNQVGSKLYTKAGLIEVIDALPLAIFVIDRNRVITLANKSTCLFANKEQEQLIGYAGGEAFGCIHHNDVPDGCGFGPECLNCRLQSSLRAALEQRQSRQGVETLMEFKGLGEKCLRISTLPMVLDKDEVVLLSIEDITEVKKYEQALLEREKFSAVIQTAGAVCHEMNQPLMVISGLAELMIEDLQGDDVKKEDLAEIMKQVQRLGLITRKLMTMTRYKTKGYLNSEIIDIDAASGIGAWKQ